jgi:predicted house-cleaning noncanonical NTP pyrophosphatase (MazG superfamily)
VDVVPPAEIDRILADDYLADLERRAIEEVRAMRTESQAVETGLSYLRRLVQGRLDIVGVELQRRRAGGEPGDLTALIAQLPEILADRTRSSGVGRLSSVDSPAEVPAELEREFEAIVADHDVEALSDLDDEGLGGLHDALETFEHRVSGLRRALFDRIDALQAEITRRYRTGEASVESLLQ